MPQDDHTDDDANSANQVDRQAAKFGLRLILLAGIVLLVALLFVSIFHPSMAERVKFFTVNALSLFVLAAIAVQAVIYRRQWSVMERQFRTMKEGLIQNERAVKAAEESVKLAQQSFHASERPHFGITQVTMAFEVGRPFSVSIRFMNGGKTPAWHFNAGVWITLGIAGHQDMRGRWNVRDQVGDMHNSFFPADGKKDINYGETDFEVTQTRHDAVIHGELRLFITGTAHWVDARGEHQYWNFCALCYPESKRFGDYLSTG